MRSLARTVLSALALVACTASFAGAQTNGMLPFDHIHVNEPAAEGSAWWEKNIPGGRRIIEAPNRIMYGAVRLMFLQPTSAGPSLGSVIEHLGFSVADLDAKMRDLAAINTKVVEPAREVNGLKQAMIEDPWGTRILLVQDPELLGLHHVQLRSPNPEAAFTWLLEKFGGVRTKLKNGADSVKYTGTGGFTTVSVVVARGESVPSQRRAVDHIGWRSIAPAADTMKMLTGKGAELETPTGRNGQPAAPTRLHLDGNNTDIFYFYVKGPDGTRIELVERPGIKPGE